MGEGRGLPTKNTQLHSMWTPDTFVLLSTKQKVAEPEASRSPLTTDDND